VRAALQWSIDVDEADVVLRIGAAVWRFWELLGHLAEGRRWMDALLHLPSAENPTRARARGLAAAGSLAYWEGDYTAMGRFYEESLALAREIGDRRAEAEGLYNQSFVATTGGDFARARAFAEESRAIYDGLDDPVGLGRAVLALSFIDTVADDAASVQHHSERALELLRVGGDRLGEVEALNQLARSYEMRGETDVARGLVKDALKLHLDLQNPAGTAIHLEILARFALDAEDPPRALRLAGVAQGLKAAFGVTTPRPLRVFLRVNERLSEALGEKAVEEYLAGAQPTTIEQAVAYGLEHG
jgi:tetratricopeptide (TPR) repeat protein